MDVVAYGREDRALGIHRRAQDRLEAADRRAAWTRGLATAGQVLAAGLAVGCSLWIGSHGVADGELLARNLAVLVLTPLALHEVLATFSQAAQTWTRAGASIGRVRALLDEPPVGRGDRPSVEPHPDPALELHQVQLGWPDGRVLASGITLRLGHGDRLAVTGASGVGKTTLAATVMGLIPPLSGEVTARGPVAYLAQDAHLFATTVAENVRIGRRQASDDEVRHALRRAGLALEPERMVGEQGATLSGGEARRVALARVLVGQGEGSEGQVYLLDEPTEHLDRDTADALMADLWASVGRAPVMVITHDPAVVASCNRRLHLGDEAGSLLT